MGVDPKWGRGTGPPAKYGVAGTIIWMSSKDATTFFTQVNQGQSQVLDILRHSGSDPQTLRWIDVTGSSSTLIRPQPFHLSPETTGGVFFIMGVGDPNPLKICRRGQRMF